MKGDLSTSLLRRELTRRAYEIASLLNTVHDDDERDLLHGHVEKILNDELYAGSVNRRDAKTHAARLIALIDGRRLAPVTDLFPRKVQP